MSGPIRTTIDPELCEGCGLCTEICPYDALQMQDDKAVVTGAESMLCGQCAAICPAGAVAIEGVEPVEIQAAKRGGGAAELVGVIAGRRSCRAYLESEVELAVLEDLVRAGTMAPSGTNSQRWTFTIVPTRTAMIELARVTGRFYEQLNTLAKNPLARLYSRLFMKDALGVYHREYHQRVAEALEQWTTNGRDRLFHGATAAIIVGMKPGASCPGEDALMASQNIVLLAEALGLGSCLVGFAVEAMKRDKSIGRLLRIPAEEKVYSVIALGYPQVKYARPAGRLQATVRVYE